MTTGDPKLRFDTLALRREMPSENHELSPVVAPQITSYGPEDRTTIELQLALSELPDETRPTTVARLLLPEGVRLETIEVDVGRTELPGRLGRTHKISIVVALVPEPKPEGPPAGHWVFIPVLQHACFVARNEDLAKRITAELAVLPAALALELDGWKRLLTWAPTKLEPISVELATTPLAEAHGRKALAEAERKRQAIATLDGAGRRVTAPEPVPPLVGREELSAELTRILASKARRSVLLVGDEAAGKSALATAWSAAHPSRLMWATSASQLVAGASALGEWQARIAAVLGAAETLDAILYFDDFGALFADRPAEGGIELGAAMRRHIVDGRVRIVGELTAVALDRAERRDVSLIGAMLRVAVPPTDPDTTIAACHAWARQWARSQPQRPQISAETVPLAVELARRYLPYRAFPGKAVRLLEELRVAHDPGRDASGEGPVLGPAELFAAFSWSTGIPVALLSDAKALPQSDVIAELRRRMIGQDAAVRRVADAISVAKARLQPADKPLASLLFVGPTGTGKTELARSVAAYLFGAPDRMVRLDMSEYTDPYAAERLFGGDGGEGRLTAAVRSQPFGVVLLDEIEKAHPSVFDLLLQVLGEARLTDARGRTTYFHNAIIVLTSNLGTRSARGTLGLGPAKDEADREERRYRDAVLAAFRPELINRLDQIVVFHPLTPAEIAKVAEIAIRRLAERRGFTQSGVILDVSSRALEAISERGFSAELGARALRRHVDAHVLAPAARLIAKAGAEAQGGTLTVRGVDEPPQQRPPVARLGEDTGELTIGLWRRGASTGRRLVRSALALGGLRRDSDRELAHHVAVGVRDKLGEIEATLATAARKEGSDKSALPGKEIARLSREHARLKDLWDACVRGQGELRTAEELCLDALARDVDAIDLIDAAILQRQQFRRDLFWLLTALRPVRPGAMLLVHSPDARAATSAWAMMALAAAQAKGWTGSVHLWGDEAPGWRWSWGPPRDLAWAEKHLPGRAQPSLLVRIAGAGADLLFGLEQGLHRFHGIAGEACHAWVDLLEPRSELADPEWAALPGPPAPRVARGAPMREVTVNADRTLVLGEDIELPWAELPPRLEEAAVERLLDAHARKDGIDTLWLWERPLQAIEAMLKAQKEGAAPVKIDFTIGVYQARKEGEEEWTALTPVGFPAFVSGNGEVRLRERMIERLRDALRKATPLSHEWFQLAVGTELIRIPVDVKTDRDRIHGTVPLVIEPRWVSDKTQKLLVYHPVYRTRWFLAEDHDDVLAIAPVFFRQAFAEFDADDYEDMYSDGKDKLVPIAFSAEPHSLLDMLPSRKKDPRGGAAAPRPQNVLQHLGIDETRYHSGGSARLGVPRSPYRERLSYLLGGSRPRSVAVIGPPGAGKTSLIRHWIADRLVEDGYPIHKNLDRCHHIWRITGKRLIAGMSYLGQWEERCLGVLDDARRYRAILWIEDLHLFGRLGQSRQSERSFADFFRGPVRRGDLAVIAELTQEQFARLERDAPGLAEALALVAVPPASNAETAQLLLHEIRALETRTKLELHPFVSRTALELGASLFPWRARPGVAIEIVKRVADEASVLGLATVGPGDVLSYLARTTGLATKLISFEEGILDAADVEAAFSARVIGQPVATRAAANVILRVRAGLADPNRPVSVMLFTGPTGTGKTELATAIAEYLYGAGERLLRIDMGELSGPDAVARLIGDRWNPDGLLTSRVRAQPFCVVLLDEIEKAHPQALHLLLQLFDEGRLTDANGEVASFASAVVIMTSNLGSRNAAPIGFGETRDRILADVAKAVREFFPVELFNRIDQVVPFEPLTPEVAAKVVDKELAKLLARRGLRERNTFVYAGAAVRRRAVADAFDARYGARTVKRWLEDKIGGALTDLLASAAPARLRIVRLAEDRGEIQASLEPMAERTPVAGTYVLEGALDLATAGLEPAIALASAALARIQRASLYQRAKDSAQGELRYYVDELHQRVGALGELFGVTPSLRARADEDDDHEPIYDEHLDESGGVIRPRRTRARSGAARPTRPPASRDALLAGIAEALLLDRALPELLDPAAHAITAVISRVGQTADAGGLGIVTHALAQPMWLDERPTYEIGGKLHTLPPGFGPGTLPAAARDVAFVLRGLFVRTALGGDHGTWMVRAAAAEPDVIRVELRPGAPHKADVVLRAHLAARAELERVLEQGGAMPPNPDVLLPVTRTLTYRPPLRPGESYGVEIEDFSTGWVDRGTARDLPLAIRRAWHLAWSRLGGPESPR